MTKVAYIMRGLPGSGKSTLAKNLIEFELANGIKSFIIHSTDGYFGEEYEWNPEDAAKYHALNLNAFEESCKEGTDVVICDNCNVHRRDYAPYVEIAEKYGYGIYFVKSGESNPEVCYERCNHNVPLEAIIQMKKEWEEE